MVDSMANSVEDYLIDGLSFKLSPGASYVAERRSVSYFPSGSNIYQSGSGARVIRVNLTGEGWLDPSTVRLTYTLVNNGTGAQVLRPLSGSWSFFRRARCLVGGAIVDDIDYYNRVHEMLHILTSKLNRDHDSIEGFGRGGMMTLHITLGHQSMVLSLKAIPPGRFPSNRSLVFLTNLSIFL